MENYRGRIYGSGGGYVLEIWKEDPMGILAIPVGILVAGLLLLAFVRFILPFLIVPAVILYLSKRVKTYGKAALLLSVSSLVGTLMVSLLFCLAALPNAERTYTWIEQQTAGYGDVYLGVLFAWTICLGMGILSLTRAIKYKKKAIAAGDDPKQCKTAITVSILNLVYWMYGMSSIYAVLEYFTGGVLG